jgi:hypothetical protein
VAQALDWKAAFSGLRTRVADGTKDRAKEIHAKTADAVGGVLERWFQSDKGLPALSDEVGALFASSMREAGPVVTASLKDRVAEGTAGARIPSEVRYTLSDLEVSLDDISRTALDRVNPLAGVSVPKPTIALDEVPVRRSLVDFLLFRGPGRIRRDVFGTADDPKAEVPAALKAKRLGPASREALRKALLGHLDGFFSKSVDGMVDRSFEAYAPAVVEAVTPAIAERKQGAEETFSDAERRLAEVANVVDSLTRLRRAMDSGVASVETLTKRHAETDPALLNRPIESATEDERDVTSRGRRHSA